MDIDGAPVTDGLPSGPSQGFKRKRPQQQIVKAKKLRYSPGGENGQMGLPCAIDEFIC